MESKTAKDIRNQGLDKFYTKPNISLNCINKLNEIIPLNTFDLIVEPSAGSGSFYNQIKSKNKIGLDLEPECDGVLKQDFFDFDITESKKNVLTIGNPPFGKVSSLAIKFFNHAAKWSNVIAFIIPKTFRKSSVQNRLDSSFHLLHDMDIPSSPCSFEPVMNVKCCFQIWIKKDVVRNKKVLPVTHKHWEFLPFGPKDENNQPTPPKDSDFALRAYGGKCGQIVSGKENLEKLRPKSWHWIKCNNNINQDELIKRFSNLDYSKSNNTARQNSIGRAELIELYSDIYNS